MRYIFSLTTLADGGMHFAFLPDGPTQAADSVGLPLVFMPSPRRQDWRG
jgi:hypothetical protein